jgi:hypothetical protein
MALLDLKTNLKSLKYGSDTPGGGNSGQPYQQVDINTVDSGFNQFRMTKFDDGLVRGGVVGAANASIVDTFRIGKFLKDFPKGPLFIAKQVGLQLSNPQLETRKLKTDNPTTGGGLLRNVGNFALNTANKIVNAVGPTRIYNLGINTLAQIPVNAFGQHFNRHGLLPVQDDQTKYLAVAQNNNSEENNRLTGLRNRFGLGANYDLYKGNIKLRRKELKTLNVIAATFEGGIPFANSVYNDIQNSRIADYIGGPSSVYGIGRTLIPRTPERTNDKLKIDAAKNRNYNAQHIPEVKISSSFDYGLSLLTNNETNLTNREFNLTKDNQQTLSGSLLNYDVKSYDPFDLAKTKQRNSYSDANNKIKLFSSFVGASTKLSSSFTPDKFPNLTDTGRITFNYKRDTLNDQIASKNDVLNTKWTAARQEASASAKMREPNSFTGVSQYSSSVFTKTKFPSLTDTNGLKYKPSTLDVYTASINDTSKINTIGKWEGKLTASNDLGVSKQYFPTSEIDTLTPRPDNTTYSKIVTQPISLTVNAKNEISPISEVIVPLTPISNRSYQTYQRIIESRQLRERTYTVDSATGAETVNAFGIYGNNTPVRDTLGNIIPDSSGSPIYSNGKKIIQINKSWREASREIRVGSGQQDQINLTPLFENATGTMGDDVTIEGKKYNINDLVKFRIQALNSNNPGLGKWMIFRAYLTQFSDSVEAQWGEIQYAGRGDKFYIYGGFGRKVSIGFKVAALSAEEMQPMYQKLNYLMGVLMGTYEEDGLLRGNLIKMTVGNWFDGQDGILNSLSYTVPQESPWEIGLPTSLGGIEPLILPHILEVSMTFTPIGSQTKGINKISEKNSETSHFAQNYNNEIQYATKFSKVG